MARQRLRDRPAVTAPLLRVEHQHGVARDGQRARCAADPDRAPLWPARPPLTAASAVPSPRLATQTEPKPTAMSCGSRPTGSRRPMTTFSRGSMRATVPSPELTTQTWLAPIASAGREVAGAHGLARARGSRSESIRVTVPRLAVGHPGAVRADGDVDRVGADRDLAPGVAAGRSGFRRVTLPSPAFAVHTEPAPAATRSGDGAGAVRLGARSARLRGVERHDAVVAPLVDPDRLAQDRDVGRAAARRAAVVGGRRHRRAAARTSAAGATRSAINTSTAAAINAARRALDGRRGRLGDGRQSIRLGAGDAGGLASAPSGARRSRGRAGCASRVSLCSRSAQLYWPLPAGETRVARRAATPRAAARSTVPRRRLAGRPGDADQAALGVEHRAAGGLRDERARRGPAASPATRAGSVSRPVARHTATAAEGGHERSAARARGRRCQ